MSSWHWACRLTPSEATSPVTRMRTGVWAWRNCSTISCCSTSDRLPCMTRTASAGRCRSSRRCSASQVSVAMRSAKTTTRSGDLGPIPMRRSSVSSAWYLPEAVVLASTASSRRRASAWECSEGSGVEPAAAARLRRRARRSSIVWMRAAGEDRKDLARVQANRESPPRVAGLRPPGAEAPSVRCSQVRESSPATASSAGEGSTSLLTGVRRSFQRPPTTSRTSSE